MSTHLASLLGWITEVYGQAWSWVAAMITPDRGFSITLEALSLLVIAPMTARFVAWQSKRKWRDARTRLVDELCDILLALSQSARQFVASVDGLDAARALRDEFRAVIDAPEGGVDTVLYDQATKQLVIRGETAELCRFERPGGFLDNRDFDRIAFDKTKFLTHELEGFCARYGFCMSPEMIAILSNFMADEASDKYEKELRFLNITADSYINAKGRFGGLFFGGFFALSEVLSRFSNRAMDVPIGTDMNYDPTIHGASASYVTTRAHRDIDYRNAARDIRALIRDIGAKGTRRRIILTKADLIEHSETVTNLIAVVTLYLELDELFRP